LGRMWCGDVPDAAAGFMTILLAGLVDDHRVDEL
jgi:hypothetical protein